MIFTETKLKGAYIIQPEPHEDERGFFARTYCEREFARYGLAACSAQCNVSYNARMGTLRGMHYQAQPYGEAKLITCLSGTVYDVIIDLRPDSATHGQWWSVELTSKPPRSMLYIPAGFAHGFQTLEDHTEVFYQISEFYHPECARGVRWNDKAFDIRWPPAERIISARDASYPDFLAGTIAA
jgi:dTDP-4-dehydrorhamnose 3,5-epimerase